MEKIRFGKTELMVSKIAFGGIPIQRVDMEDAIKLVRGAIRLGVNFFDTANAYDDSEEKIGLAIQGIPRENLILASKTMATDKKTFLEHLDLSLKRMGTDYIDLYQHHNISSAKMYEEVFAKGGAYEGLVEAIDAGKVRFPAFSSHSLPLAIQIMKEGKFAAVQLPLNYIDDEAAKEAVPLAKELDMGFIAMKPFGGGLLSDAHLSMGYLSQFDNIVPDPGIEKLSEIEEIIRIVESTKPFTSSDEAAVAQAKAELGSRWCHRCDYCLPCPQGIGISTVLNVKGLLKRMPYKQAAGFAAKSMEASRTCTECRVCVSRCPYKLDIPTLLKENWILWENYPK